MATARLIVCERRGHWAPALRIALGNHDQTIVETRSLIDCWREIEKTPAALAAVQIGDDPPRVMQWLVEFSRRFPAAKAVALAEPEQKLWQWPVREAGAIDFITSVRQLPTTLRLIHKHLALAPRPPSSFRQSLWDRLPWKEP